MAGGFCGTGEAIVAVCDGRVPAQDAPCLGTREVRASAQMFRDQRWRRNRNHACCHGCLHLPVFCVGKMTRVPKHGVPMWVPAVSWHATCL